MEENFIRERITKLRIQKNVSEYKMSLDLGHSKSYIQSIASGRSLPSMSEFLYICEYLDVSPSEFFNEETDNPILFEQNLSGMRKLGKDDLILLHAIIQRLQTEKK
ncbi:MAG: helix-turn-helix domain-containing protein [Blautia sp.]|nr:helix-turn-helix domain-containing protein [Blautia sp.]MDY5031554.1 helix-turn-helix transcriptional regulator [Blautia sp.]